MLNFFIKKVVSIFKWIYNLWSPVYKTVWTENLPDNLKKRIIYIVGGKEYPFQAVFLCPKSCSKTITLNISKQHQKSERWSLAEHKDGTVTLYPSVWMKTLDCNCHYWFKKGRIIWT